VPVASFASSILSSKDHPTLVIGALQLVDMLLSKLPSLYNPAFRREGVFHEIELLSERPLTTAKAKDKEKEKEGSESTEEGPPSILPPVSSLKKASTSLDPEDASTLRARVIQFKYLSDKEDPEQDGAFQTLCSLVGKISAPHSSDKDYSEALWELAELFASPHTSVSSFELLKSGVVDSLLQFATDENRTGTYNPVTLRTFIHRSTI
jgi:E3 ubiquitin-protein ligase TRIP12